MFEKKPTIDVLLPVYNRELFVGAALDSIAQQTYQNFRLIIYDDGSSDRTRQVIHNFLCTVPTNINWTFQQGVINKGVGYARNRLLDLSISPYCIWQDSDDISHPQRLEIMLHAMQNTRCDMVFSSMYFFQNGRSHHRTKTIRSIDVSRYTSREGLFDNTNFATGMFKRELAEFRFDESLQRKEDIAWLTRLIKVGKTFGYVDEPLYWCRRHEGRLTYGA